MIVLAAAFLAHEPLAGGLVQILADVRLAIEAMTPDVTEEGIKIVPRGHYRLRVIAQQIAQGRERLRGGERPNRAVPFAPAAAVRAELGVAPLGGREAVRRAKALRIDEL